MTFWNYLLNKAMLDFSASQILGLGLKSNSTNWFYQKLYDFFVNGIHSSSLELYSFIVVSANSSCPKKGNSNLHFLDCLKLQSYTHLTDIIKFLIFENVTSILPK